MTNRDKFNGINNDVLADMLCVINGGVECKFCSYEEGSCLGKSCFDGIKRWLNFMTNRDEFTQMSNLELADILKRTFIGYKCKFCTYTSGDCFGKNCVEGIERWLNAPCANDQKIHLDKVDKPQQEAPAERNPDKTMINNAIADNVNHPAHYNRDGAMECIREMVVIFGYEATINFCNLNAWKYRYRSSEKNGAEDMAKSDWYVKKAEELKSEAGYF